MSTMSEAPFSHLVKVGRISSRPATVTLTADAADLRRLAATWSVPEVLEFTATLALSRWKRDGVRIKGHVAARILQECVVTLEPVETAVDEDFETIVVPEDSKLARMEPDSAGEIFLDPEGPDLPDTYAGDSVDIGAIAAEFAALGIDLYPRKPGVAFTSAVDEPDPVERKPSPFAALKALKSDGSAS
ncbi:uncharacterized protein DUF177 involved in 23S rRNA accumulation [Hoeflea marina]|uniref:Uncharacterized protein DUF177 involved in 23S rRNA accumulation n=1 Tax=Hoeflea marina TaxID=274592 RepID=A0A317PT67_9HYPH|nr:DUF177 domain-containing protein [Hoeflea marina]PWW03436.1 uncharacterized protein DUF177 involved in 23S rRNA accumulation [Hoeflea marina]